MNGEAENPVGVFDSGIGGLSVVARIIRELPNESIIYYGDSQNAPYGTKSIEEVMSLTRNIVDFLMKKNIKVLLIACNTITSVAVGTLRKELSIPVIGMEPALKPAAESGRNGTIVVMATPLTLGEKKFGKLMEKFSGQRKILPLPCPGLADLVEKGHTGGEVIRDYLEDLFRDVEISSVSDVVLGCTHYIFIKNTLKDLLGSHINIVDGNDGTVRNLKNILQNAGLLHPQVIGDRLPFSGDRLRCYITGDLPQSYAIEMVKLADEIQSIP